jgi:hypothetical protein
LKTFKKKFRKKQKDEVLNEILHKMISKEEATGLYWNEKLEEWCYIDEQGKRTDSVHERKA